MLAGHFGLAAIVKSRQPQLPMWALMLSTQLLNVVFVVLLAFGLESIRPEEGTTGGYGQFHIEAIYSHSLVGALGISLAAMLITWVAWGRRNGIVIGALTFSHWLLDFISHRPAMPLLPGDATGIRLGLGLWSFPWVHAGLELGIVLAGAFLYYHAAMRSAVRAERQDLKAGVDNAKNHRNQALVTSIALLVFLLGTLLADVLGF